MNILQFKSNSSSRDSLRQKLENVQESYALIGEGLIGHGICAIGVAFPMAIIFCQFANVSFVLAFLSMSIICFAVLASLGGLYKEEMQQLKDELQQNKSEKKEELKKAA